MSEFELNQKELEVEQRMNKELGGSAEDEQEFCEVMSELTGESPEQVRKELVDGYAEDAGLDVQ